MQQWILNLCSVPPSLGESGATRVIQKQPESSVWRGRRPEVRERTLDAGVWLLLSFLSHGFSSRLSGTRLQLGRFRDRVLTGDFHHSL